MLNSQQKIIPVIHGQKWNCGCTHDKTSFLSLKKNKKISLMIERSVEN